MSEKDSADAKYKEMIRQLQKMEDALHKAAEFVGKFKHPLNRICSKPECPCCSVREKMELAKTVRQDN